MPVCKDGQDPCDVEARAGTAWSVCLPFGGRIWSDGSGVHGQGGYGVPDGVYGKIVVANGCLVGVEPEDVPLYTGSPCAPLPNGCGGASAHSADIPVTFAQMREAEPVMACCEIAAGAGVQVTGSGTETDPYIISADTGIYIRSENYAIAVTGSGTRDNPFTVKHKTGLATTVNGMTFDAFGHLASVGTPSVNKGVTGIVPGQGISVAMDNSSGIATVSLREAKESARGRLELGGYAVTFDDTGRLFETSRIIEMSAVKAVCGATDISVNEFGSITDIVNTLNQGASYLCVWGAPTAEAASRGATVTLRNGTALVGLCLSPAAGNLAFFLDGHQCGSLGGMFWGNGVYAAGEHELIVTPAPEGDLAVLLMATAMADSVW